MVLWKRRKKIIHGTIPNSAAALWVVTTILCSPWAAAIANGTVCFEFEIRKISGKKKSFHVQIKKKVKRTDRVGRLIGVTILVRIWNLSQPSILAASTSSFGKVLNIEVNK